MRRFVYRRLVFGVLTMWGITVVVFSLSRAGPDPMLMFIRDDDYGIAPMMMEHLRVKWGLDKPIPVQYVVWMGRILRGDLGKSLNGEKPVRESIQARLGATVQLAAAGWVLATLAGIPLGVLSAVKRASVLDYLGRSLALVGQGTPSFWLSIVAIYIFAVNLGWLPVAGREINEGLVLEIKHMVLPAVVLAFEPLASYVRLTRSSMLEVLDSEYVKLARAKGVPEWLVIWKHGFKNALIQPLTVSALVLASFITGVLFIETVFAWPGIARLAVQATWNNDFPLLSGIVLFFGVVYVGMNFVADMLYALVDPRIRYS